MALEFRVLDLTGYKLTFDDEFGARSISQSGAATTWADIRPYWRLNAGADIGFGTSAFVDPASGIDPFQVANGALTITAVQASPDIVGPGTYASGLLHTQQSFSQTYGYFEMRADLPEGAGVWPAFWLLPQDDTWPPEIDVVEAYGNTDLYSHVHTKHPGAYSTIWSSQATITAGYHTFGVLWDDTTIRFYFDGRETGGMPTPVDMHGPMYMLVDLAVSAGTTADTLDSLKVDHIRAYSSDPDAVGVTLGTVSSPDGADTAGLSGATAASVPVVHETVAAQPSSWETPPPTVAVTEAAASTPPATAVQVTVPAVTPTPDGEPAHRPAELLWRHADGAFTTWSAAGTGFTSKDFGVIDRSWHVQAAADFDADGRTDLLWRQDGGAVTIWAGTASGYASRDFGVIDTGWTVAGTGDVTGDGRADILWRGADGLFAMWKSTGDNFASVDLGERAAGTQLRAVGDFDGDGKSDLLWQDAGGAATVATSQGTSFTATTLGTVSADWHVRGAGDFDGDGRTDLLWQNDGGALVVWTAAGNGFTSREVGGTAAGWHIDAVSDLGGDGRADIVWRHDSGALTVWAPTGGSFVSRDHGVVGTDWHIV